MQISTIKKTFVAEVGYSVGSSSKLQHIVVEDFSKDAGLDIAVINPRGRSDSISVFKRKW
jgi:hypothetical protein